MEPKEFLSLCAVCLFGTGILFFVNSEPIQGVIAIIVAGIVLTVRSSN